MGEQPTHNGSVLAVYLGEKVDQPYHVPVQLAQHFGPQETQDIADALSPCRDRQEAQAQSGSEERYLVITHRLPPKVELALGLFPS